VSYTEFDFDVADQVGMPRSVFLLDETTARSRWHWSTWIDARSTSFGGGCRNPTAEYHTCFHLWMIYC
jgi:hypothetical protein